LDYLLNIFGIIHNSIKIDFDLKESQNTEINIYSITGEKVSSIFSGQLSNQGTIKHDVSNLTKGLYIIEVRGEKNVNIEKIMIM
jgi:hypothetical protein